MIMYINLNSRLLSYRQLGYTGRGTDLSVVRMPKKGRFPQKRKSRPKPNSKKSAKRSNEYSPWRDFVIKDDGIVINLYAQRTARNIL
jgi:hypothetical protein